MIVLAGMIAGLVVDNRIPLNEVAGGNDVSGSKRLMEGVETGGKILLTSGRISSEILLKAARRGVAVLASRSAPTSLAAEFAEKAGVTLVGFVRGRRMNIYSNDHRIE